MKREVQKRSYVARYGKKIAELKGGWYCHYCKSPLVPTTIPVSERSAYKEQHKGAKTATIDHVIPLSKGGYSTKRNMVLACEDCNSEKANKIK